MSYSSTDTDRRLANVIQIGTVTAVDPAKGAVQVDFGGPTSDWLPWSTKSAGGNREWEPIDEGTQVIVAAPSGDLSGAVVIGCIFQDAHPEPSSSGDVSGKWFKDGAVISYDREAHAYLVDLPAGSITLRVGASSVAITDGGVAIDAPTLTHNGVDIGGTHQHPGVLRGGAKTDPPG